jgi:hypothetical protein
VAKDTTTAAAPTEELPSFVPAPKSLISNSEASEVAAINNGLTTASQPVNTAVAKPIETSIATINPRSRIAQILMGETTAMKAGETKQFAVELKSHVPLALAVVALKFNPKVVKVRAVTAGSLLSGNKVMPSIIPSIDANGMCLVSVSGRASSGPIQGAGTLILIEVEAIADGNPGFSFDQGAMHIVATDGSDVVLEVMPVIAKL